VGQDALKTILAISLGASLGAPLRWLLGLKRDSLLPPLPPGILLRTLWAPISSALRSPILRRLLQCLAYGGCRSSPGCGGGGFTTFSTFSAEFVSLLQQGRTVTAGRVVAVHVIGSVVMTFLGIGSFAWVNGS
jgi:fluoride exporter